MVPSVGRCQDVCDGPQRWLLSGCMVLSQMLAVVRMYAMVHTLGCCQGVWNGPVLAVVRVYAMVHSVKQTYTGCM